MSRNISLEEFAEEPFAHIDEFVASRNTRDEIEFMPESEWEQLYTQYVEREERYV